MTTQQQKEQTQASFQRQQLLFDASIQCLLTELKVSTQDASSPLITVVTSRGVEHSSAAGDTGT
eukprot:8774951-Ditylum_brightwellii.AAC.1